MLSDRSHYPPPSIISVNLISLSEGFIYISYRRYEWRTFLDGTAQCFPIIWISPAVILVISTPSVFETLKKLNCSSVIGFLIKNLRENEQSHGVVGISYGKSLGLPK